MTDAELDSSNPLCNLRKPVCLGNHPSIVACHCRMASQKKHPSFPPIYCVFLILYITLLRRAPGYNESIRLRLKLWPNAGIWAGVKGVRTKSWTKFYNSPRLCPHPPSHILLETLTETEMQHVREVIGVLTEALKS